MTHETVVRQVLDGHVLPHDEPRCGSCFCRLREGARVGVLARSTFDAPDWEVADVYCIGDTPDNLPETPHGETVLAHGRVGMLADVGEQTHELALLDVRIVDCALDAPEATT